MNHTLSFALLLLFLFLLCACTPTTSRYATAPEGYGNNAAYTKQSTALTPAGYSYSYDSKKRRKARANSSRRRSVSGGLPVNPDPNKCYVRCVTMDEYEAYSDSIFTYTEEDAMLYAHREVEITLKPELGRWEATAYEGCESDDPDDCQVLCYRTYPAETITFYEPVDTSLGNPYWDYFEIETLNKKGGLTSYEEVDCELTSFNILPIAYKNGSAALDAEARQVINDRLLVLLEEWPNMRFEINAHTTSIGSAASNQQLSERRAQSVADYLVSQGVNRQRLVTKGLGESQLKNHCADGVNCSEGEHAVNRRVEFRVLNMDM